MPSKHSTLTFVVVASLPIILFCLLRVQWWRWSSGWSFALLVLGLLWMLCLAADRFIQDQDKQNIRFNVMRGADVLQTMLQGEVDHLQCQQRQEPLEEHTNMLKGLIMAGLEALARKYGQLLREAKIHEELPKSQRLGTPLKVDQEALALICQEASYVGFRCFPTDDAIVVASISLLALVAKVDAVRERHLQQADRYGLDIPVERMQNALERARQESNTNQEQQSAELQRKGCLLFGALSDGDKLLANQVVQEGGLQAILDAVDWYRYHADVANWAFWAIFNLCYENIQNKIALIQLNGVPIVTMTMKYCPDSIDVARHGIAILFDLMRENENKALDPRIDIWKVRDAALNAGLHQVILNAMSSYSDAIDIMMMGQEILAGTGFQGPTPTFVPKS